MKQTDVDCRSLRGCTLICSFQARALTVCSKLKGRSLWWWFAATKQPEVISFQWGGMSDSLNICKCDTTNGRADSEAHVICYLTLLVIHCLRKLLNFGGTLRCSKAVRLMWSTTWYSWMRPQVIWSLAVTTGAVTGAWEPYATSYLQ